MNVSFRFLGTDAAVIALAGSLNKRLAKRWQARRGLEVWVGYGFAAGLDEAPSRAVTAERPYETDLPSPPFVYLPVLVTPDWSEPKPALE